MFVVNTSGITIIIFGCLTHFIKKLMMASRDVDEYLIGKLVFDYKVSTKAFHDFESKRTMFFRCKLGKHIFHVKLLCPVE